MSGTPYRPPKSNRLSARLSDATLAASVRMHRAYLALHPGNTLDDLYRAIVTKLMKQYERECIAKGIQPKQLVNRCSPLVDRKPDQPPTHIQRKKSPTYDEL